MDNLWPESFQEIKIVKPLDIIEKQAEYLSTLTEKLVYGAVENSSGAEFIKIDKCLYSFNYNFDIKAKYIGRYSFRIFSFAYDIPIYPVSVILNDEIQNELKTMPQNFKLEDSDSLINLLRDILHTNKVREVVGSLISLSKDYLK